MEAISDQREKIEKSLRKKFRRNIYEMFVKAVNEYGLINDGDRIGVCISGGKDSMLMAKLFQEYRRHFVGKFETVFMLMDPGYSKENKKKIIENAELLGIELDIFESRIFENVENIPKSPCYICARMRRGALYNRAKELKCNKIALGHHFNDVVETVLMGILYSGQFQAMMPKLRSQNFPEIELIRPMYYIREDEIKNWQNDNGLQFIQCACAFTEKSAHDDNSSKRLETKQLIGELLKTNPYVERNIFNSTGNIFLNKILGYRDKGNRRDFMEWYEYGRNLRICPSEDRIQLMDRIQEADRAQEAD